MAISSLQSNDNDGAGSEPNQVHSVITTMGTVTAGSAIVVFNTLSDFAGVHNDLKCTDSQLNTYALLDQRNSNSAGGAATTASWLAVNVAGGANTVTNGFTSGADVEDFQAAYVIEVGGVAASPLVGHSGNTQNALANGTNNVLTGTVVVSSGQCPCRMYAIAMNTNGSGNPPTVGTGMTLIANAWGFGGSPNTVTVAYRDISVAGTYQGIFNQVAGTVDVTSNMVIVTSVGGTLLPIMGQTLL